MKKKLLKNMEWSILVVSILLVVIGTVALFSATQDSEYVEFKKQLQWLGISIPFLILAITIDYNVIIRFSSLAYIVMIGLLIGVLFTDPISGASSWYKFGESFTFQPSELAKVIVILFLAFILNKLQLSTGLTIRDTYVFSSKVAASLSIMSLIELFLFSSFI